MNQVSLIYTYLFVLYEQVLVVPFYLTLIANAGLNTLINFSFWISLSLRLSP